MYKKIFNILGLNIGFEMVTNKQELFNNNDIFKYVEETSASSTNIQAKLIYEDSLVESIMWFDEEEILILKCPWNEIKNTETLKTLVITIIQYILQKNGYFTIHASAVGNERGAILLFGSSGSGKTVTALKLCKEFDYSFVSNGSSIAKLENGQIFLMGSLKKGLKFRYSSLHLNYPELASELFKGELNSKNKQLFNLKKVVLPSDIGIPEMNDRVRLTLFNTIKLTNDELSYEKLDNYRTKLIVYEDISRHIKNTGTVLLFGHNLSKHLWVPSLDSKIIHKKRSELIESLCENYLGYSLYGEPNKVASFISK